MSHPCLSVSSTSRRKYDRTRNDGKSPQQSKAGKRTRIAFDGIESMDASDYLSEVVREAKGMPDIFVDDTLFSKPNDKVAKESGGGDSCGQDRTAARSQSNCASSIDGSAASLSYLLSRRASMTPPPSIRHLPKTENVNEWTTSVVSNFERLRGYLERSKTQGFGGKLSARMPLPTMKDRSSWHVFCVGMDEASGNSGAYFADEYGYDDKRHKDHEKTTEELQSWRSNIPVDGYEPSVCLLLQMDQVMIRRVLSHLIYYVNLGWSVTSGTGRRAEWIYALLARLEKPVHRDDAAVLFGLLKNLTLARSKIDFSKAEKDTCNLAKLNVLIVLVGVYFEQGSLNKIMSCE